MKSLSHFKTLRLLAGLLAGGLLVFNSALAAVYSPTPYAFVTIAGTAKNPGTNDGTNAVARFDGPYGVALDGAGNLYVADYKNDTIRKLTPSGTNWVGTTIAGTAGVTGTNDGSNQNIQFQSPIGIAADSSNNLYVVDGNNTVRKLSQTGTNWASSTIAGTSGVSGAADGTNGVAQFNSPYSIAADASGNLYVADFGNSAIRKVTLTGTNWVVTTLTITNVQLAVPVCVTVDHSGTLFVSDDAGDILRAITPTGNNWSAFTIAGSAGANNYVDGTNSATQLGAVFGITVDANDNLYLTDEAFNTIRKVSPVGTNWVTTTIAGSVNNSTSGSMDGTGTNALFDAPLGIVVDSAGRLYVADTGNDTIRQGTKIVVTLPTLTLSLTALKNVLVTWPTGYTLQTNLSLTTPASWGNYAGTFSTVSGTNSATLSPSLAKLFFRLSN